MTCTNLEETSWKLKWHDQQKLSRKHLDISWNVLNELSVTYCNYLLDKSKILPLVLVLLNIFEIIIVVIWESYQRNFKQIPW